uniref:Uncharacterized protein n=1 Tax=Plectus sambesii TaxID=2011161 RepID=A0A914WNK7_9BILA
MSSGDDLLQFDLENIALHIDICMALLISNLIVLALSVAVLLYGLICDHHGNDENEVICSKSQCCITSHGRCRLIFLIVLLNATGLVLSISSMILFFNISTGNLKNDVKRILNDASEINEKGFEKLEIKHRCCGVLLYSGHVGANKNCPVAGELPNCTDTISAEFVSLVAGILLLASALIMQLSFFFVFCFCHRLSLNTQVPSNAANTNENHELNPLNPDHDNANEIVDENG